MDDQPPGNSNRTDITDRGGLAGALERGQAARRSWTEDGTVLTASEFASRRGVTVEAVLLLETRGQLFSVEIDGSRWYPAELLRLSPGDSAAVCSALAGLDPSTKLVFVMRCHGALGGKTVAAAVADGEVTRVLALAAAWRAEDIREARVAIGAPA